jgi:ribosomal 30S subunit maturation factor RimM
MRVTGKAISGASERLIPFVAAIVDRVDVDAGRIDVDWGEDY